MAYLGNTPTSQNFTSGTDYFNGNGSTVAFTLTRQVSSINDVIVVIENVVQKPLDAYSIVGTTLTFTSAPPSGTNNIYVRYVSTITTAITPNDLSVTTNKIADGVVTTAKIADSNITTAKLLDAAVTTGKINDSAITASKLAATSTLNNFASITSSAYHAECLIVAGDGGTTGESGGGGGGGGIVNCRFTVNIGTVYTVNIGAGGASQSDGGDSYISGTGLTTLNASGGGRGGGSAGSANNGGSGGGGGWNNYLGGISTGVANKVMGNYGGSNFSNAGRHGAGGGGAGTNGAPTTGTDDKFNGFGGHGLPFTVWTSATGTSNDGYFGGGGGGGGEYYTASSGKTVSSLGGMGGGGLGCYGGVPNTGGTAGRNNSGGGGGGQCGNSQVGLTGGSGIVIIRYVGAQRGTGGTVAVDNGYTYHTFTSSGTYTA